MYFAVTEIAVVLFIGIPIRLSKDRVVSASNAFRESGRFLKGEVGKLQEKLKYNVWEHDASYSSEQNSRQGKHDESEEDYNAG